MAITASERTKLQVGAARDVGGPKIVTVTPKMALKWLKEDAADPNRRNRGISTTTVAAYARDMANSRWQLSEAAICWDEAGTLLNGQHRLHACCMADQSFQVMILRGLPRQAQEVMDQHRPRRIQDVLALRGYANAIQLAAAARRLMEIKDPSTRASPSVGRITAPETLAMLQRHPKLIESVSLCATTVDNATIRGIAKSTAAALHYVGTYLQKQPDKADAFIRVFQTGIPAYAGDPAHKLREKLISRRSVYHVMKPRDQFKCALHAWNSFIAREKIYKFHVPKQPVTIDNLDPDLI